MRQVTNGFEVGSTRSGDKDEVLKVWARVSLEMSATWRTTHAEPRRRRSSEEDAE
jgi:hypothetical protein